MRRTSPSSACDSGSRRPRAGLRRRCRGERTPAPRRVAVEVDAVGVAGARRRGSRPGSASSSEPQRDTGGRAGAAQPPRHRLSRALVPVHAADDEHAMGCCARTHDVHDERAAEHRATNPHALVRDRRSLRDRRSREREGKRRQSGRATSGPGAMPASHEHIFPRRAPDRARLLAPDQRIDRVLLRRFVDVFAAVDGRVPRCRLWRAACRCRRCRTASRPIRRPTRCRRRRRRRACRRRRCRAAGRCQCRR